MRYKRVMAGILAFCLVLNMTPATVKAETLSQNTDTAENTNSLDEVEEKPTIEEQDTEESENEDNSIEQSNTEINETDNGAADKLEEVTQENTDDISVTSTDGEFTLAQLKQRNDLTVSDDGKTVTVSSADAMILLSHCQADELKSLTINIIITGQEVNLTSSVTVDGTQYTFAGIGNADVPFEGNITGQRPVVKANRAFFGGLSSKATVIAGQQIKWDGDGSTPMLADTYVLEDGAVAEIPILFSNGTGAIVGEIKGNGILKFGNQVTYRDKVSVVGSANAGLLCNTLESGTVQITEKYNFPAGGYSVTASAGNAGGLIGQMNTGTKIVVDKSDITLSSLSVTASAGNAGGIAGQMGENAEIVTNQALTLNNPTIIGSGNTGGLIGQASNVLFSTENQKITLSSPSVTATAGGTVGGVIGRYELSGKGELKFPACIDITNPVLQINKASNGKGYIGGYFGVLGLTNNTSYTIGNEEQTVTLNVTMQQAENVRAYGSIAGNVFGNGVSNSIILKNVHIVSDYRISENKYANFHGGLVGELGEAGKSASAVYLEVDSIDVQVSNPYIYNNRVTSARTYNQAFGGIVGLVAESSVSKIGSIKLSTGNAVISAGGGVVGTAKSGSVVELSGVTDLSDAKYDTYWSAGQIVGYQDCALIYAKGDGNDNGWIFKRGTATQNNDIGNYGHVIRLKAGNADTGLSSNLIQIAESTHEVKLAAPSDANFLDGIEISNTDDFALLSIAWITHGAFAVGGVTTNDFKKLEEQNITLNSDVDLTGTGITGISRDCEQDGMVYSGTINGNNHTVKLTIGETFGLRDDNPVSEGTEGGGKIYPYKWGDVYSHTAIGMFAQAKCNVTDLVIDGTISLSNISDRVSVGGLAAMLKGNGTNSPSILSGLTVKEKITADAPRTNDSTVYLYAGGVYGEATDGTTTELRLQDNTKIQPELVIQKVTNASDKNVYAGGVIGYAAGNFHKLACNGAVIGGSIKVVGEKYNYAYVGGLIARTNRSQTSWIEIRNLSYDGFVIDAPNARKICGGLFGSLWANVSVYFMGENDNADGTSTKLTVADASINAPSASVGGLVYRSSGFWEIRNYGIDMEKFNIKAERDVGLLVCRGERGTEIVTNNQYVELGALYLKTTKYWDDGEAFSYRIGQNVNITVTKPSIFDEFVAYTAASADAITTNNINGIVSVATKERTGVSETNGCTTYVNRTAFGKQHQANACSRYYYDLDQCYNDAKNNTDGYIDTPQELMLWSVYQYADTALKGYFLRDNGESNNIFRNDVICSVIGSSTANNLAHLDMKNYSYYPVNLEVTGITVQNAEIQFYNEEIEKAELDASNKSTYKSADGSSQHYTMHCGLFLNHIRDNEESIINVSNVTFQGTIGKTEFGSGVIFGGNLEGNSVDGTLYLVTLNVEGVTLDGLRVYNCEETYAPLLINRLANYTTLVATDIEATSKYDENKDKKAASSLIGNVGSDTGNQINMTFSKIAVPDKTVANGGIFTHATLLESFQYASDGVAVATYNFIKAEDWKDTEHIHEVTYGKEISNSEEYDGLQLWYFDREGYGEPDGNKVYSDNNNMDFSEYLPYVCNNDLGNNKENAHEIRVNQRPFGITTGCGTYGHPYKITSEKEMKLIAEYLATKNAQKDWEIRITTDQTTICSGEETSNHDLIYQYQYDENDKKWKWKSEDGKLELSNDVMHLYMLSAYYDIEGSVEISAPLLGIEDLVQTSTNEERTLTITDFRGFGTEVYPFRGVITCTDKENPTTIILKGSGTGNGLIPYSYGSVVKDITISYQKDNDSTKSISYVKNPNSDYYPSAFFGGVIGCIMGGDNIIDNVSVEMSSSWMNFSGDNKYLIQAGGYVGSIVGGGVIFRKIDGTGKKSGLSSTAITGVDPLSTSDDYLYVNPYVGRVLDGYAFSEGSEIKNTDKNYKINKLDTNNVNCIKTTGTGTTKVSNTNPLQTEVKNAQGLLILSAIVNSGAASGGDTAVYGTNAYSGFVDTSDVNNTYRFGNGLYGKVRNASYNYIGTTSDASVTEDFAISVSDDRKAPGYNLSGQEFQTSTTLDVATNAPYLVKKYANPSTFYIGGNARSTSIAMSENGIYDMSEYGTGYQGISARYLSNALYSTANKVVLSERVVPWITSVDGNGSTLKVNMPVKEYSNDDFHAASVGGMFNVLRQVPDEVPEDERATYNMLQKLTIGDSGTQSEVTLTYIGTTISGFGNNNQYNVGVGGFAGSTAGVSNGVKQAATANVRCEGVSIYNLRVDSPGSAGGLFGNTGRGAGSDSDIGKLIGQSTANTYNNYFGLNLINCKYDSLNIKSKYASGGFAGYVDCGANELVSSIKNTTNAELEIGKSTTITTSTSASYAGGVFGYIKTNLEINNTGDESGYKDVILTEVNISATTHAGGYIGQFDNYGNSNTYTMNNAAFKNGSVTANNNIGGLVGNSESRGTNMINCCTIENVQINKESGNRQSGGLIGRLGNSGEVEITYSTVKNLTEYGAYSGGVVGEAAGKITVTDTKITGTESTKNSINSVNGASGIYGRLTTSSPITIERCKISYTNINTSAWSAGAFSGDILNTNGNARILIYDSVVEHTQMSAPYSGGMAGQLRGTLIASNIGFSDVNIIGRNSNNGLSGVLVSDVGGTMAKNVYVAGISLQNTKLTDKTGEEAYNLYGYAADVSKDTADKKCYIAFADYTGSSFAKSSVADGTESETSDLLEADEVAPYVVISPKSSMQVEKDGKQQYLYGDGAVWAESDDNFTLNAKMIVDEKNSPTNGHFAYKNTGVDTFDFVSTFSTYNKNQTTKAKTDFPVLQISSGDASNVSAYLDILTNGGFSAANALNSNTEQHVTVQTNVYSYQEDGVNGKFVYDEGQPVSLRATTDQNGQISFHATTDYDNDNNRFVLLTVTFEENGHCYNLYVPVLVRRMLEVDFTATLSHGTHFKSDEYDNIVNHVLGSFDNTITGYLTYVYNSAGRKYVDYGWQSYVDAGGDIAQIMDKRINCNLPAGTHLSLVDCQDENKTVYYHDITDEEAKNQELVLSNFENSSGEAFVQSSIGELLGVKVEKNSSGKFIKVDSTGKPEGGKDNQTYELPTVRVKGKNGYEYYRLAGEGETGAYLVTIDETVLKDGTKSTVSENYYLVITVPDNSTDAESINGGIDTWLNITVPKNINYLLRDEAGTKDSKNNTASTYQISKGYEQSLTESLNTNQTIKLISARDSKMNISIKDEITFPNGQAYLETDQLYQKFVGSIQINHKVNGEVETSTTQFPSGTSGIVHYYVYTESENSRTYYSYVDGKWTEGTASSIPIEVIENGFNWTSDGGNMELILSTDGTLKNAISLQEVRDKIKGTDPDGTTTFYVEAVMEATLPAAGLEVIPESKLIDGTPEEYAKLLYTSLLSTEQESLSYSNNRAACSETRVSYYREAAEGVQLTYEADYLEQLGINLLDLGQNVDADKQYANIDTTAQYDLSSMKNLKDTLCNSSGIRFTLQLVSKNTDNTEEYGEALPDASDYIEVKLNSADSGEVKETNGVWSWTIPKETYIDEETEQLKNNNVFNGAIFTQIIRLKIKLNNIENKSHYYSNYKAMLNVDILDKDGNAIADTHGADNIIYTLTKINPEFVE